MNQNICYNCGGEIISRGGRFVCSSCGSYMPEQISGEEVSLLYAAFQKLRLADFYEAEREFDDIIRRHPRNAQGYWGRLMSHYGIKYEKDYDGRCIPTCYATSIDSVYESSDYRKALELADAETQAVFKDHADYMERVRKEWLEKASREKPYDIFISFKDSDTEEQKNGREHTVDSDYLRELYFYLLKKGYRVFFSRESLEDKGGEKYEPYIYAALSTAKVMLVYGSKPEYINATWVKNEWTRYQKRIRSGEKHPDSLIVAYKGFSPKDLPLELSESGRQHLDASKDSFYIEFLEIVDRVISEIDSKSKTSTKPKTEKIKPAHPKNKEKKQPEKKTKNRFLPIFLSLFSLIIVGCIAGFIYFGSNTNQHNDEMPSDLSEGLAFELNDDGTYSVIGIGTCTDTEITIPSAYKGKSITSIAPYAFDSCVNLVSITIPDSVTSIGNRAFESCSNLTSITIPDSVTKIGAAVFRECNSITSMTLPFVGNTASGTSNTYFGYIFGASRFYENSKYVPSSLKTVVITGGSIIENSAFFGCTDLTRITILSGVTSIDDSAFSGCTGLTIIAIPDDVTSIGYSAFYNCTNLTDIQFNGKVTQWEAISFSSDWNDNTGYYTVTCTDGTISKN